MQLNEEVEEDKSMTPREFIEKGRDNRLKERASYQLYFHRPVRP